MKLSIILPTYNERRNISILIPKIEELFKKEKHEIIIVDDNSPDGTALCAQELNKRFGNIKTIVREKREGIGAALRQGYDEAIGDIILSMDSDLSFSLGDLHAVLQKIDEGYDLVVGSRHTTKENYEMKLLETKVKGFVSRFGNKITSFVTGIDIHDFSANFRGIRKEVWKKISVKDNTNTMLLEMILKAYYSKFRIAEVPVLFKERVYGVSKLNLKYEAPKFFIKLIYYTLLYRFGFSKIQNKP